MPFVADRRQRAGRWLEWKVRIFAAAAVLALCGLYLEDRRFTGVAIVLLFAAVLLRFLPGGREEDESELDGDENGADEREGGGDETAWSPDGPRGRSGSTG
jgi:hypothetical protein